MEFPANTVLAAVSNAISVHAVKSAKGDCKYTQGARYTVQCDMSGYIFKGKSSTMVTEEKAIPGLRFKGTAGLLICRCTGTLKEMQDYTSRFNISAGMAVATATKSMTTSWKLEVTAVIEMELDISVPTPSEYYLLMPLKADSSIRDGLVGYRASGDQYNRF
ncbi:hypothetical protein B0H19DRAFT_1084028 [Mycena capillaripes]|nr:hypothetical protein B0H19DRAFT_1084028 [Mycena capillaripes]